MHEKHLGQQRAAIWREDAYYSTMQKSGNESVILCVSQYIYKSTKQSLVRNLD